MGKQSLLLGWVLLVSAVPSRAQETLPVPPATAVEEVWESAHLDGFHVGSFRTTFQEIERDDKKLLRSRQTLQLTVKRFHEAIQLRMTQGTDETEEGKVAAVFMEMGQSGGMLKLSGDVKNGVLHVEVDGGRLKREIPWNDKVIGLQAQERFFQRNPFKPGDKFSFGNYEPSLNTVVQVRVTVHDEEEVELPGGKVKLVKAILQADEIKAQNMTVQLPPIFVWMDKDGKIARRQVEIPGLGAIVLVRTKKEIATARLDLAKLPDIGLKHLIFVPKRIARKNATTEAVYRITIPGDKKLETALVQDDRQKIAEIRDDVVELRVKALRLAPEQGPEEGDKEFLETSHYLDSGNDRIQRLAKAAVGTETDPWNKARQIEAWVNKNITFDAAVPFGPASEVAKKMRGDCRQCAFLTAAMCKAAGVPARTAIGLIYGEDRQNRPMFGFHMWTEVWVRGRWLGLDATLGEGSIGATHIKITDHSWHNTQSMTPLLPLQRVLGKMKIEVVRVEYGE